MIVRNVNEMTWEPIKVEGVHYKVLRQNDGAGNGGTTLVSMKAGSRYPLHRHPGREQALVLKGRVRVADDILSEGGFWVAEAGEVHDVEALEDVEFFVLTDKSVKIVD